MYKYEQNKTLTGFLNRILTILLHSKVGYWIQSYICLDRERSHPTCKIGTVSYQSRQKGATIKGNILVLITKRLPVAIWRLRICAPEQLKLCEVVTSLNHYFYIQNTHTSRRVYWIIKLAK